MKAMKGILIGAIFGCCLSFCISFLFMLIAQFLAGGFTSFFGDRRVYYATIIPFILTFVIIGFYFTKEENVSNKKFWLISLIGAFFITLYSGTVGALFGEYIVRGGSLKTYTEGGYTGVNVEDVLVWGTIYAFIILPFTLPVARIIIQLYFELMKKIKVST